MDWYRKKLDDLFVFFGSSKDGLLLDRVKANQQKYGPNALPEPKPDTYLQIFIRQFKSPIIYILLIAAVIVFVMKESTDGFLILFVLLINAVIGLIQEGKSQNTLLALKKMTATSVVVLRDGKQVVVNAKEIAPGDVVVLKDGDKVPADARIIESETLEVEQAALTGESTPIQKFAKEMNESKLAVADQDNMVFKGTYVVRGEAKVLVVAVGTKTVIGQIAKKLERIDADMPLKENIRALSRLIIIGVVLISIAIFVIGIVNDLGMREVFRTVVAIAVSAIPEGLPVVVTLILATGVMRMSKQNALVKRLQAVEALGQARVIALDKTGTITKNQMAVTDIFVDGKLMRVEADGYEPKGRIFEDNNKVNIDKSPVLGDFAKAMAFASTSTVAYSNEHAEWKRISGDPTEAALVVLSEKMGYGRKFVLKSDPQIDEIPFQTELKYHASLNQNNKNNKNFFSIAGAPEALLPKIKKTWKDGKLIAFGEKEREHIYSVMNDMTQNGLRVLVVAGCETNTNDISPDSLPEFNLLGIVGIIDAIRSEVGEAVRRAREANIRIVMITGDHVDTARAIAKKVGIFNKGNVVISGQDLENMSKEELSQKLPHATVFARVSPDHKLQIIEAYKERGEIVAMTGDGVNDALSLAAANLGVSMGRIGTEVAKEASDIILLDDNFESIVAAIEEGRGIYRTIRKVIFYLLSTNIGEVFVIMAALLIGFPLPVVAGQILWLNFVTDGFLVIALGLEPREKGLSFRQLNKRRGLIVDELMISRIVIAAIVMSIGTLFVFSSYAAGDYVKATTIALTALAIYQWFNAWNARSSYKSIFSMKFFENKYLVFATLFVIPVHFLAIYNPFMQKILHTTGLNAAEWLYITLIAVSIIVVEEIRKLLFRRFGARPTPSRKEV